MTHTHRPGGAGVSAGPAGHVRGRDRSGWGSGVAVRRAEGGPAGTAPGPSPARCRGGSPIRLGADTAGRRHAGRRHGGRRRRAADETAAPGTAGVMGPAARPPRHRTHRPRTPAGSSRPPATADHPAPARAAALPPPKTLPARAAAQPPREPLPRSPEPPPTRQRPEPQDLPVPGLQSHSTCPQPTRPTRPGQPSRPDPTRPTRPGPARPVVRRRSGRSSRWCGPAHRSRAPSRPRPAVRRSPPRA